MVKQVTITATMATGLRIVEYVDAADFGTFVEMVLGFRRDSECIRLTWHVTTVKERDQEGAPSTTTQQYAEISCQSVPSEVALTADEAWVLPPAARRG